MTTMRPIRETIPMHDAKALRVHAADDTLIAAYLVDPGRAEYLLDDLAAEYGFELEPEITAKLLRRGHRNYEVPISYAARSREEGKKLTWMDGVKAIWTLARLRV